MNKPSPFLPGRKIRKTRGEGNLGKTCTIVALNPNTLYARMAKADLEVRWDEECEVRDVLGGSENRPAGTITYEMSTYFDEAVPIITVDDINSWTGLQEGPQRSKGEV